jgi:hypothetical protein
MFYHPALFFYSQKERKMIMSKQELSDKIRELQQNLDRLIEEKFSLNDPEIVKASQELDNLLAEFEEIFSKTTKPKFSLGRIVITCGAKEVLTQKDLSRAVSKHASCNWGLVCQEDKEANDLAVEKGYRILSSFKSRNGVNFWIITEADRSATTILLPSDY